MTDDGNICFIMVVHILLSSNHRHVVAQIETGENSESIFIRFALHDDIAAWELA